VRLSRTGTPAAGRLYDARGDGCKPISGAARASSRMRQGLRASQRPSVGPGHTSLSPSRVIFRVGVRGAAGGPRAFPRRRRGLQAGLEAGAVGLALDDEIVGAAGEAIDGALGAERIGEGGQPFVRPAVADDDHRAGAMAFQEDVVGVAALLSI